MSADSATQAAPAAPEDNKKNGKDRKRDETPIEELYDLTKPIPKVSSWPHLRHCSRAFTEGIAEERNLNLLSSFVTMHFF